MKSLDIVSKYIGWHYGEGSKVIWKSVESFLKFISKSFSTGVIFKIFPTTTHNPRSLPGVLGGIVIHIVALVLRLSSLVITTAVYVVGFIGSITVFILWMIFPVVIVLFILEIVGIIFI